MDGEFPMPLVSKCRAGPPTKMPQAMWFKLLIIFQLELLLQLAKLFSYSYSYQCFPVTVRVTVIFIFQLL